MIDRSLYIQSEVAEYGRFELDTLYADSEADARESD